MLLQQLCNFDERLTINVERLTINVERWTMRDERWTINVERWTAACQAYVYTPKRSVTPTLLKSWTPELLNYLTNFLSPAT